MRKLWKSSASLTHHLDMKPAGSSDGQLIIEDGLGASQPGMILSETGKRSKRIIQWASKSYASAQGLRSSTKATGLLLALLVFAFALSHKGNAQTEAITPDPIIQISVSTQKIVFKGTLKQLEDRKKELTKQIEDLQRKLRELENTPSPVL